MSVWTMRENWGIEGSLTTDEHRKPGECISTYYFSEVLGELLSDEDVLTTGGSGLGIEIFLLSVPLLPHRDVICSWSLGPMGGGPPTAIGACIGSGRKQTICIGGDGGFQLNIQELETIQRLNRPIKFFILCNDGYASMRVSQMRWFGRSFGADESSGLTLPPLDKIADTYGFQWFRLVGTEDLGVQIKQILAFDGPVICEVPSPPNEIRPPAPVNKSSSWTPTPKFRVDAPK